MMFCRLYQSAIQNDLDDFGKILRPTLIHHLQKCRRCRAFYHHIKDLETQLRSESSFHVSDEQVQNIAAAVRRQLAENPQPQKTASRIHPVTPFRLPYGITAAAAMLLVCLLGIYAFHWTKPAPPIDPAASFVNHTAILQNQVATLTRLPEKSLQMEMQKLAGDARTAVNFFAGCIPANPADTNPAPEQNQ